MCLLFYLLIWFWICLTSFEYVSQILNVCKIGKAEFIPVNLYTSCVVVSFRIQASLICNYSGVEFLWLLINYLYLTDLSLCCCLWTFSSCGKWGWDGGGGGGYSLVLLGWLFLLRNIGSGCLGFSSRSLQALEHRISSCGPQP